MIWNLVIILKWSNIVWICIYSFVYDMIWQLYSGTWTCCISSGWKVCRTEHAAFVPRSRRLSIWFDLNRKNGELWFQNLEREHDVFSKCLCHSPFVSHTLSTRCVALGWPCQRRLPAAPLMLHYVRWPHAGICSMAQTQSCDPPDVIPNVFMRMSQAPEKRRHPQYDSIMPCNNHRALDFRGSSGCAWWLMDGVLIWPLDGCRDKSGVPLRYGGCCYTALWPVLVSAGSQLQRDPLSKGRELDWSLPDLPTADGAVPSASEPQPQHPHKLQERIWHRWALIWTLILHFLARLVLWAGVIHLGRTNMFFHRNYWTCGRKCSQ